MDWLSSYQLRRATSHFEVVDRVNYKYKNMRYTPGYIDFTDLSEINIINQAEVRTEKKTKPRVQ